MSPALNDCRILVAEDEYILAANLCQMLEREGATVLGPAASLSTTINLLQSVSAIDAAILDINLKGELAFPAADLLSDKGVPFIFCTGYDASMLPQRFNAITRCDKPVSFDRIVSTILSFKRGKQKNR